MERRAEEGQGEEWRKASEDATRPGLPGRPSLLCQTGVCFVSVLFLKHKQNSSSTNFLFRISPFPAVHGALRGELLNPHSMPLSSGGLVCLGVKDRRGVSAGQPPLRLQQPESSDLHLRTQPRPSAPEPAGPSEGLPLQPRQLHPAGGQRTGSSGCSF